MNNEYFGVPTTPTSDYLAHYGIKGMKWGVRKARESGNANALGRQYRKAEKKLAKLEKRASSGSKYARRAALLGAGAGIAGASAIPGTGKLLNKVPGKYASLVAGRGAKNAAEAAAQAARYNSAYNKASKHVGNISNWGNSNSISNKMIELNGKGINAVGNKGVGATALGNTNRALNGVSNKSIARAGAAAVGAGLLGAAGYNAYRAATTKRAARKAAEFRKEMNKQFAGTQYASGGTRKRRRR